MGVKFNEMNRFSRICIREWRYLLWSIAYYFPLCPGPMFLKWRASIWRKIGIKIGENVGIGFGVYLDVDGFDNIEIEDDVLIAAQSLLLTHRRDIRSYKKGELQRKLEYIHRPIKLCKNCSVGMRTVIMPGITIGEGAVVGANSTVTKDIPPYTVAIGNPAKVIKVIE